VDEHTAFTFDGLAVNHLALITLPTKISIQSNISRLVERQKLSVFND
jgi:hypothetical protein